jgi:hypothetical protein
LIGFGQGGKDEKQPGKRERKKREIGTENEEIEWSRERTKAERIQTQKRECFPPNPSKIEEFRPEMFF